MIDLMFLSFRNNWFCKTLVYFERIKKIIAENKQALVLLPKFLTNEFRQGSMISLVSNLQFGIQK